MKAILNLCCAASFSYVIVLAFSNVEPSPPAPVAHKTAGTGAAKAKPNDGAFSSHARSKVVQYFDTYRADPLGLPADCAAQVHASEIPASWTTGAVACGTSLPEADLSALVRVPNELVRVLPAKQPSVRYYLAGSNFVAVDFKNKVVDSIWLPTVRVSEVNQLAANDEMPQLAGHLDRRGR